MILPLIVSPQDIIGVQSYDNILLIDLSDGASYLNQHLPKAIHLDYSRLLCGIGSVKNKILSTAQISVLFTKLGVTEDTHVVVYDNAYGMCAARLIWTWHMAGNNKVSYLNGGVEQWRQNGLEVEQLSNQTIPTTHPCSVAYRKDYIISAAEILQHLNDNSLTIWDTRSEAEFLGVKRLAAKGGHIPGAIYCEWFNCLNDNNMLKNGVELTRLLEHNNLDTDQTLVPYCQTHRRSSLAYLAARVAGVTNIKCYDGAWTEWGNLEDAPVEN